MLLRPMIAALALSTSLVTSPAWAHGSLVSSAQAGTSSPAEELLHHDLGRLGWKITTSSAPAQAHFDQGLRWAFAFNHAAAVRAFREAQRRDPACAMCYWGEAFALGPNINAPMEEGALAPALAAVAKAKEAARHASAPEQALIQALAQRYGAAPGADRKALDQAYAEAMAAANARFADDHLIAVLFADAVMNTSPWDYWEADGKTAKGRIGEAIAAIERLLRRDPDHAGAIHLYIHLVEASATPGRAEPYADRLVALMPDAGHMVHMASHIYYRIGRFRDSVRVNQRAVLADEAYFARATDESLWKQGYHPHNVHFVAVSALMAGDAKTALDYAAKLEGRVSDGAAAQVGWIQLMRQALHFIHAHLADPTATLALPEPGDAFPLVKASWHYARGVAFARQGRIDQAHGEAVRIAAIRQRTDIRYPADIEPVAGGILDIARHVVEARIAAAEGDWAKAVAAFEAAARIQDGLAYLEPPFWYYPVRQSLGAALIRAGRPKEAEQAFQESLAKVPNNGWALYGLLQAQMALGEEAAAQETKARFDKAWAGDRAFLDLSRL